MPKIDSNSLLEVDERILLVDLFKIQSKAAVELVVERSFAPVDVKGKYNAAENTRSHTGSSTRSATETKVW
jgi:hypothetical protein